MHTSAGPIRKGIACDRTSLVMISLMRRLPSALAPLILAALALGGCGENDAVYSTRQMPSSSEDAYAPMAQRAWSGDKEVYELPAQPPALDDLHRSRTLCVAPGQRMKPTTIAGVSNPLYGSSENTYPLAVAGMSDRPDPLPMQPMRPLAPVAGWQYEDEVGARERLGVQPYAVIDKRPVSQASSGTDKRKAHEGLVRTAEADVWCGEGAPPTSPIR